MSIHLNQPAYRIRTVQISHEKVRLVLQGVLGHESYHDLEATFTRLIASGVKLIVVDLEQVTEMRSSVFSAFLQALALLRPMGGTLSFSKVNGLGERVFKLLDLDCAGDE